MERHRDPVCTREALIHTLFEEQVKRRPDAIAIVCGEVARSYREVNAAANQLARYLRTLGVGAESLIGLCVERSPEAIIAMLAVLKAGGAYVPLDPAYQPERLQYFIEDTKTSILLTQEKLLDAIPSSPATRIVRLDADSNSFAGQSDANLGINGEVSSLAYVMYTSGSTGRPKGVMIPHRAVVRLVKDVNYVDIDESSVFLQLASLSFDAATFEIWAPLLNGARLAMMPPELPSLDDLGRAIQQYGVTTLWLTAGLFHLIVDERIEILGPLRQLLAGGDVLSPRRVDCALRALPNCRLINGYGPTENTTFTCSYTVPRGRPHSTSVPIGKPISNTEVWILDAHRQPVPIGTSGELYIGGDGLALGYLNNPELSAEKFVPDPFSSEADARLYRSGDLARFLPDGNIEFLGRADSQVKIDGFRIELGEVESALTEHPDVAEAVVVMREEVPGRKRLVAYIIPWRTEFAAETAQDTLATEVRDFVRRKLPGYMCPVSFSVVAQFPLTENGKVDRSALPAPRSSVGTVDGRRTPRDGFEAQLLNIWEEVIGVHPIRLSDNFFDLGGHSLMALYLFARISKKWGKNLPLATLLLAPTVEQLAEILRRDGGSAPRSVLVPIQTDGSQPPLYIVSGAGGNVVRFYNLARNLGRDQPVYGLLPPGLIGEAPLLTNVEEIAARYISEIKTLQPEGPYFLAGYSFGGTVTFEMARQLTTQGDEIGLLALLDAEEWSYLCRQMRSLTASDRLRRWRDILWKVLFEKHRLEYLVNRLRRRATSLIYSVYQRLGRQLPRNLGTIEDVNTFAATQYVPKPYAGCVTVFAAEPTFQTAVDDQTLGWGQFALGGVDIYEIPGEHDDITSEPNVGVLSQKLASCLKEAQRGSSEARLERLP